MSKEKNQPPQPAPRQTPPPQRQIPTKDAPGKKHYSDSLPPIERRSVTHNTNIEITPPKKP